MCFSSVDAKAAGEEKRTRTRAHHAVVPRDKKLFCFPVARGGHGAQDMQNALINSCDVYFYQMGERMGIDTGCDLFQLMDMAEERIFPLMDHIVRVDRSSLTLGFAGVYSTFLLHANRAAERFGIPARDILVELGRKKMIGGQEDMILDTAMTLAKARGLYRDASV